CVKADTATPFYGLGSW
nr:immunoglobulin heavy chain junction region [Macaca mulatta]MOV56464.1 immunoglobulin heavy chain junction region [Macaca mulatta]MOV57286.1 immunoglobulin heavy chain junction region [Macaca mulatta]MOV58634.1 immunoglobulin heavy chain junction region [Macaca mulatta]MOV59081.1 immunoglobulin heavy chain junction region [Macaca mulatta]